MRFDDKRLYFKILRLKDRQEAIAAGAEWIAESEEWAYSLDADRSKVAKWLPKPVDLAQQAHALEIRKEERAEAKAAGAVFDWERSAKLKGSVWWCPKGKEEGLSRFFVRPIHSSASGGSDPREALIGFLRENGIDESNPSMDGRPHRAALMDGKKSNKDAMYVAEDGERPSARVTNFKSGETIHWRHERGAAKGANPVHRAAMAAEQELRSFNGSIELAAARARAREKSRHRFLSAPLEQTVTPYQLAKGIPALPGVKSERDGTLLIPAYNSQGEITTVQSIFPERDEQGKTVMNGKHPKFVKLFEKSGEKKACFHVIGTIRPGREILIAEGYATGATLHLATKLPVVVAFDAGNLLPVAQAIAAKHPESMLAFMADNDQFTSVNEGFEKASLAAGELGGAMVAPRFASLDGKPTDWNDLAAREGMPEVERQLKAGLRAERARLMSECLEAAYKAGARAAPADPERFGAKSGVAWLAAPGIIALESPDGSSTLHASRLFRALPGLGERVSVIYRDGLANVSVPVSARGPRAYAPSI
jgi:putative DNA primase/helicase